jgi:hypothetical protein
VRSTPWTPVAPAVDPEELLTIVGVRLCLRSGSAPAALTAWVDRLRPELDRTPDLAGYALQLTGGRLWVVSAWSRRGSLAAFERGRLHTTAERELQALLHPPVVAIWRAAASELPPSWDDVRGRLRAAGERTRDRLARW